MKCSNDLCDKLIEEPTLTVMVGDLKAGNYWGIFCSYECAIQETAGCWKHLSEGKTLASFKPDANTQVVIGGIAEPVVAPAEDVQPMVNDAFAWEGNDGIVAANPNPQADQEVEDEVTNELNKVWTYVDKMAKDIVAVCNMHNVNITHTPGELTFAHPNGELYESSQQELTAVINAATTFDVFIRAKYDNAKDKIGVGIVFAEETQTKYNLIIDPDQVLTEVAVPAVIKHLKACALDYAANNNGVAQAGA